MEGNCKSIWDEERAIAEVVGYTYKKNEKAALPKRQFYDCSNVVVTSAYHIVSRCASVHSPLLESWMQRFRCLRT